MYNGLSDLELESFTTSTMTMKVYLALLALTQLHVSDCQNARRTRTKQRTPLVKLPSTRIAGGKMAAQNQFPYQALVHEDCYPVCGGSIINPWTVLTAAHCISMGHPTCGQYPDIKPDRYRVQVGKTTMFSSEPTEQTRNVSAIVVHESYDDFTLADDIAVLHLDEPLVMNEHVTPVTLSDTDFDKQALERRCVTSGWGIDRDLGEPPGYLMWANVTVVGNTRCSQRTEKLGFEPITRDNICTIDKNVTTCNGDTGGPMGCYDDDGVFRQVGVVTWSPSKCGKTPSVYMRVSRYLAWIQDNVYISRPVSAVHADIEPEGPSQTKQGTPRNFEPSERTHHDIVHDKYNKLSSGVYLEPEGPSQTQQGTPRNSEPSERTHHDIVHDKYNKLLSGVYLEPEGPSQTKQGTPRNFEPSERTHHDIVRDQYNKLLSGVTRNTTVPQCQPR